MIKLRKFMKLWDNKHIKDADDFEDHDEIQSMEAYSEKRLKMY